MTSVAGNAYWFVKAMAAEPGASRPQVGYCINYATRPLVG